MYFLAEAMGEVNDPVDSTGSYGHRVLMYLLGCIGAVLACTALGLFFGSTGAHAAEESPGLLDGLTSSATEVVTKVVDEVVSPVASAATSTANDVVTEVTEPVVEAVASLPVPQTKAGSAVNEAIEETLDTASGAVSATTQGISDEPVSGAIAPALAGLDPLLGSVERVPVVGHIVDRAIVIAASGASNVDSILGSVADAVDATLDPITTIPIEPAPTVGENSSEVSSSVKRYSASPPRLLLLAPGDLETVSQLQTVPPGSGLLESTVLSSANQPGAPPAQNSSTPTSSAASGGGSGATAACIAATGQFSLHAWEQIAGAYDDALPPSPVFDTDVSPG